MSLSIKILESNNEISKKIYQAIAKEANIKINKNSKKVRDRVQALVPKWISGSPEMASILSGGPGSLGAQFGISRAGAVGVVDAVAASVAGATSVHVTPVKSNSLKGGIEIRVQPSTFNNLLSLQQGVVITKKGASLPWLDWLLLKGSQTIVVGYTYIPGGDGRSGGGTMQGGGSWRVPPQYSGTKDNNFITRSLIGRDREIQSAMRELFK